MISKGKPLCCSMALISAVALTASRAALVAMIRIFSHE